MKRVRAPRLENKKTQLVRREEEAPGLRRAIEPAPRAAPGPSPIPGLEIPDLQRALGNAGFARLMHDKLSRPAGTPPVAGTADRSQGKSRAGIEMLALGRPISAPRQLQRED